MIGVHLHAGRVAAIVLLLLTAVLRAQDLSPQISDIQKAYDALKFDEAEKLGRMALQNLDRYSPADLVRLHLLMGYIGFMRSQMVVARQNFESALSLQPDLTLDSLLVSPKIVRLFEQVKREYRAGLSVGSPATKYVLVEDRRMAALRRSFILPGWGQRHLQKPKRGLLYTLGFVAAVGAGVVFHVLQERAHDRYLDAASEKKISQQYDTYNRYYRLRNAMFATAGGIWGLNVLDILSISPQLPGQSHRLSRGKTIELSVQLSLSRL